MAKPHAIPQVRGIFIQKYSKIDSPEKFRNGRTQNGTNVIIQRGDIISLDSDIMLLGLVTDSHQHAYVLQNDEEDVPEELKQALITVNKMQDLFIIDSYTLLNSLCVILLKSFGSSQ